MAWYRAGSVNVTNGNATVVGNGTDFVANVRIGHGFIGPDGRTYEIAAIVSATQLTLAEVYLGATQNGQAYKVQPTQSYVADLANNVVTLINSFASVRDGIGQGLIASGSAALPAIRFAADQDTGVFLANENAIGLATGGVGRLYAFSDGSVQVGSITSPGALGVISSAARIGYFEGRTSQYSGITLANLAGTGATEAVSYCDFLNESGSTVGHIFHHLYPDGSTSFSFAATPTGSRTADRRLSSLRIATNAVSPGADNTQSLGFNAGRWTQVFATTGTINTSDEREKLWRGGLTANELAAARRVVKELGFFQWSDAVGEKGEDDARFHFGIRAQQVVRIFMEEGVEATQNIDFDPAAYIQPEHRPSFRTAFLCFDSWQAKSEGRQRVTVSSVLGANGEPMQTTETESIAIHPAGNRFGLRVDQLAMFIAAALTADLERIDQARAGMAAQVTALSLRVAALEAAA